MREPEAVVADILVHCSSAQGSHLQDKGTFESLLRELSSDSSLLTRQLTRALENHSLGRPVNMLTTQQIVLGQNEAGAVRVNIWPTLREREVHLQREKKLLSYEDAHDHNFDFVTIGHFGPGYTTDIYTYDRKRVQGFAGESVDLAFLKRAQLRCEDILWFESGKHVHTQFVPDSISASINIIFKNKLENSEPQFYFDLNSKTITSLTDNTTTKQMNFLDICRAIPSEVSHEIISFYAKKHESKLLQQHAAKLEYEIETAS